MSTPSSARKKAGRSRNAKPEARTEAASPASAEQPPAPDPTPAESVALPPSSPEPAGTEDTGPIPAGVRQLLAVYRDALDGVEFPDVSCDVLARGTTDLIEKEQALEAARAALADADQAVQQSRAELLRLSERGLAYARIYAAEDPALTARLGDIKLGTGKPRGRKPGTGPGRKPASKAPSTTAPLPSAPASIDTANA